MTVCNAVFASVMCMSLFTADPKGLAIGDRIPDFQNLPTADGKQISLSDIDKEILVLVVTCNECPVARSYESRFIDFVKKHGGPEGKVALLAINPYDREGDTIADMRTRVAESGLNFPYAQDSSQKLGKELGATKTPHIFVFDKDRKLVYKGAFDDEWTDRDAVKNHYVDEVVTAILSGGDVPPPTEPVGCPVYFKR